MWKAMTLVASTFLFSAVGMVAGYLNRNDVVFTAIAGCVAGFAIGYLALVIAVTSDRTKPN